MNILMTGATGLIGSALGQRLVKEGHKVRILSRTPERAYTPYPSEKFLWDGVQAPSPEVLQDIDVLIHLAGENIAAKRWTTDRKQQLVDSRIQGLNGLRQAIERSQTPLKLFISASATGFYGDRGTEEVTESSEPGKDFLARLCVDWEAAAQKIPADRSMVFRFGVVMSDRGGFLSQVGPMVQRFGASPLGSGQQYLPWIHLQDLVEVFVFALHAPGMMGVYNVTSPLPVRNADLMRQLSERLHSVSAPSVPRWVLKATLGELSEALTASQRVKPLRLQQTGFQWKYPDIRSALENLLGDLKPGEVKLIVETWLSASREEVWPFFSCESNLERLTPPFLQFHVLGKSTPQIEQGTCIDYRLKLHGVPVGWRSEISLWDEGHRFVDKQVKGPFDIWHHMHEFEPLAGGTLMRDTVHFKVPFGWLGAAVSLSKVMKDVNKIFSYRMQVIEREFSSRPLAQ